LVILVILLYWIGMEDGSDNWQKYSTPLTVKKAERQKEDKDSPLFSLFICFIFFFFVKRTSLVSSNSLPSPQSLVGFRRVPSDSSYPFPLSNPSCSCSEDEPWASVLRFLQRERKISLQLLRSYPFSRGQELVEWASERVEGTGFRSWGFVSRNSRLYLIGIGGKAFTEKEHDKSWFQQLVKFTG